MQKSLPFEKSSSHRHLFNAETPIKILYVDDNEDHLLLVKEWLEKSRKTLQVVLERNGEKALEELEKHSFNLILLDYQLAGIDGLEVLRRLKQRGLLARSSC
ncbi:MAG: response regulator [bacterium]